VLNLVSNAVKFTHAGHVFINVECLPEDTGRDVRLLIAVEDTGIGIPEDKIEMIFDKFTQVDASTTRHHGGTGLGLAISRHLAERMNGTVEATSQMGRRSTFWFALRLAKDDQAGQASPNPPVELAGLRVLIAEHDPLNRRILHEHLCGHGLHCDVAGDPASALGMLHEAVAAGDPFCVALLDHHLPEMDGERLARAIKADPALRKTILVLLTPVGQAAENCASSQAGFAASLSRPIRPSRLLRTIERAIAVLQPEGSKQVAARSDRTDEAPPTRKPVAAGRVPARVLVAEDNPVNQKMARLLLQKMGYRVDLVASGQEAVAMSEMLPYDLVLMDCQMPQMDGYEATAAIRRREASSGGRRTPHHRGNGQRVGGRSRAMFGGGHGRLSG
jgi:CheY-like chemotaxis protein